VGDYFFDTSALVKRYLPETGSRWVTALIDGNPAADVIIASVTRVELIAAMTRRARGGTLAPEDAIAARARFRRDLPVDYQVVSLHDELLTHGMELAEIHGLRGYDAIQLAVALEVDAMAFAASLPPVTFVSADRELNAVAAAEGMAVENPNDHP
jgi:predicted nucleic acid-binding protein